MGILSVSVFLTQHVARFTAERFGHLACACVPGRIFHPISEERCGHLKCVCASDPAICPIYGRTLWAS
eukprot:732720-Pyramimonas_sp.AAC.1